MFNKIWPFKHPRSHKVMFDNVSELKTYLVTLITYFSIKPFNMVLKNPQSNNPVEQLHQVIFKMLVANCLNNKLFTIYRSTGWNPILYSIIYYILLSPHFTGRSIPRCIWYIYDIRPYVSSRLVGHNYKKIVASWHW